MEEPAEIREKKLNSSLKIIYTERADVKKYLHIIILIGYSFIWQGSEDHLKG